MRVGVHLPNDGRMSGEDWDLLGGLGLVKGLVRLDNMGQWDEIDWPMVAQKCRPDCTVMLRLFFPGRLEAGEFVRRGVERLKTLLPTLTPGPSPRGRGGREVLVEIHNEPNHRDGIEGWGRSAEEATDFAWWYAEVLEGMDSRFRGNDGIRFGWPGLALGEWAHGERTWAVINRANIRASDWIGVHCYWQRPGELDDPRLGANWRWYRRRWPNRQVYVTECGNSSCHNPELRQMTPERQQAEYVEWCRSASAGGVRGVAFYMLGGSEEWRGFRLWPGTVRALAGARSLAALEMTG